MKTTSLRGALFIVLALATKPGLSNKLKQLEVRMNALNAKVTYLENKIFTDEIELRHELESIWNRLNGSDVNYLPEDNPNLTTTVDIRTTTDIGHVLQAVEMRSDLMLKSFVKEKAVIRNYVKQIENEMISLRKQHVDSLENSTKAIDNLRTEMLSSVAEELTAAKTAFEAMIQTVKGESERCTDQVNELKRNDWNLLPFAMDRCLKSGWSIKGISCYKLFTSKANWIEAVQECSSLGAHLVEVDSLEENVFLTALAVRSDVNVWLGGSDILSEGNWVWQKSQKPFRFQHWNVNEPNNGDRNDEDCVEIYVRKYKSLEGLWNDGSCSSEKHYICEMTVHY